MDRTASEGRENQRKRTRKDLLRAANRLSRNGQELSLEAVAAEALVSRATAYRYFPSLEALLAEASLDLGIPSAEQLFTENDGPGPADRLKAVDRVFHDTINANEPALRLMLIHTLRQGLPGDKAGSLPKRQNRREPLIKAALEPVRDTMDAEAYDNLCNALALVIGSEAMIVFKDVLRLNDRRARRVKAWAIEALVEKALSGG